MGKYDELTRGQTEALINKLGGMGAVTAILSGEDTPSGYPEERAYLKSLNYALVMRNFFRSWDEYAPTHADGTQSFQLIASCAIDGATNLAINYIKFGSSFETGRDRNTKLINTALIKLTELIIREGENIFTNQLKKCLNEMNQIITANGDPLNLLQTAWRLRGLIRGAEIQNDLILSEFDIANEKGRYKRAGK